MRANQRDADQQREEGLPTCSPGGQTRHSLRLGWRVVHRRSTGCQRTARTSCHRSLMRLWRRTTGFWRRWMLPVIQKPSRDCAFRPAYGPTQDASARKTRIGQRAFCERGRGLGWPSVPPGRSPCGKQQLGRARHPVRGGRRRRRRQRRGHRQRHGQRRSSSVSMRVPDPSPAVWWLAWWIDLRPQPGHHGPLRLEAMPRLFRHGDHPGWRPWCAATRPTWPMLVTTAVKWVNRAGRAGVHHVSHMGEARSVGGRCADRGGSRARP